MAADMLNANANIPLDDLDLDAMEAEVADHMRAVFRSLRIDTANDHNTKRTPERFAKMLVREVCRGRFAPKPDLTDFPNVSNLDQIYTVGPLSVRSTCSHHFAPIIGSAWVGLLPSDRVLGLSKFSRLTRWIMERPQIQEEATVQLADAIEEAIQPQALAVVVRAEHLCMTWRGVREHDSTMTTSVMRGLFKTEPTARAEFLALIAGQGYR